jgi:hypothetical protein
MTIQPQKFTLSREPLLLVRTIDADDLEDLRNWKNANAKSFFDQSFITEEGQQLWYRGYQSRAHDHMFIIVLEGIPIGCLGYRLLDDGIDFYNVIRGVPGPPNGEMSRAFQALMRSSTENYPHRNITVKVTNGNPAMTWYQRNGFTVESGHRHYVLMKHGKD